MPRTLVLLAAILFGTTGTAQALGPDAAPVEVGAARIAVAGVLLTLVARRLVEPGARRWDPRPVAALVGGIAGYQLCFFAAVDDTGVAVGTVVALGSAPTLAGLLARAVDGAPLTRPWMASTALATLGVLLLVLAGADARVSVPGVLLALGAGASYAIYTVASKRLLDQGHAPEAVMARGFGVAAVLLLPVLLLGDAGWVVQPDGIALAVYLGAVPTALAYVLFARGLRSLSAGETATLTLAEPVTASLLGALVLDERPGAAAVVGGALVLAGLAVLAVHGRGRPLAEAAA
jgi:DME family drug/metabolite transporter